MTHKNQDNSQQDEEEKMKRFVIVTGDKGGVGKSTFARALFDFYISQKFPCVGYDADTRNPQLERHFCKELVHCVNIFERGGADRLLTDLETAVPALVLVDMPAQSGGYFTKFEKEMSFFDSLKELGYRVTMVSVLNRVIDSVNVLNTLHQYCKEKVDYVVVKNLFYSADDGSRFERYNEWEGRKKLIDGGAVEIEIKDLFFKTYDFVDSYSIGFTDAITHKQSNIAIKGRIRSWLLDFEENIYNAPEYLGLNTSPMSDQEFNEKVKPHLDKAREAKKCIAKIESAEAA